MVNDQLLIKQYIVKDLVSSREPISIKFNLQRGYIARILGFNLSVADFSHGAEGYVFVRKAGSPEQQFWPDDLIWSHVWSSVQTGTGYASSRQSITVSLPKPYRLTKCSLQTHTTSSAGMDLILLIYYDIDIMHMGEATQILERPRQRGVRTG